MKNITNLEKWESTLDKWKNSGFSQREFCLQTGINYSTFQYWRKKIKDTEAFTEDTKFIEISDEPIKPWFIFSINKMGKIKIGVDLDLSFNL